MTFLVSHRQEDWVQRKPSIWPCGNWILLLFQYRRWLWYFWLFFFFLFLCLPFSHLYHAADDWQKTLNNRQFSVCLQQRCVVVPRQGPKSSGCPTALSVNQTATEERCTPNSLLLKELWKKGKKKQVKYIIKQNTHNSFGISSETCMLVFICTSLRIVTRCPVLLNTALTQHFLGS